eukprot:1661578-Prymnesium_polylepis.2
MLAWDLSMAAHLGRPASAAGRLHGGLRWRTLLNWARRRVQVRRVHSLFSGVRPRLVRVREKSLHTALQVLQVHTHTCRGVPAPLQVSWSVQVLKVRTRRSGAPQFSLKIIKLQ